MQTAPDPESLPADDEYRYPDFFCIGAQKSGTTWLDVNLRRQPCLWLPPIKELHYFNELYAPASRKWAPRYRKEKGSAAFTHYVRREPPETWDYRFLARVADIAAGPISDKWYGRIFALAGHDQICGEISPDYCTLRLAGIEHILRLSPAAKIVLSVRDPIDRSWSHLRMMLRGHAPASMEDIETFAAGPDICQRTDYPGMISKWRAYVPDDRFLVIFMDDIETNPQAVLKTICEFLGVAYRPKLFKKSDNPIHVGEAKPIPPHIEAILKEQLRPVYEGMAQLYPEIGERWMSRHY
jgi:hypothetical protein